jgi:hypothetical protein
LVREGLDFGMTGDEIVRAVKKCVVQHERLTAGASTRADAGAAAGAGADAGEGQQEDTETGRRHAR